MADTIRIDREVYMTLLQKKGEYERKEQQVLSFSDVVKRLLAEQKAAV